MTLRSQTGALAAFLISLGVHGVAAYLLWVEPPIRAQGARQSGATVRPGNGFADMAAGKLTPQTPDPLGAAGGAVVAERAAPTPRVTHSAAQSPMAEPGSLSPLAVEQAVQSLASTPPHAIPPRPTRAEVAAEEHQSPQAPAGGAAAVPAPVPGPATGSAPAVPTPGPLPAAASTAASTMATAAAPVTAAIPTTVAPVASPEIVGGGAGIPVPSAAKSAPIVTQTPVVTALSSKAIAPTPPPPPAAVSGGAIEMSARPRTRPQTIAQAPRPSPPVPLRRGNAQQDAVAASPMGSAETAAVAQTPKDADQDQAAGNAATNTYRRQVFARIARVPRPRVGSGSTVTVSLTITDAGRLGALEILQSSGSARLDQAVLSMIRRAPPFPRPPAGARRSYKISLQDPG